MKEKLKVNIPSLTTGNMTSSDISVFLYSTVQYVEVKKEAPFSLLRFCTECLKNMCQERQKST